MPVEDYRTHLQNFAKVAVIFGKIVDEVKSVGVENMAGCFFPEKSMDSIRDKMAIFEPLSYISYREPLVHWFYVLQDLISLFPMASISVITCGNFYNILERIVAFSGLHTLYQKKVAFQTMARICTYYSDFAVQASVLGMRGPLGMTALRTLPDSSAACAAYNALCTSEFNRIEFPRPLMLSYPQRVYNGKDNIDPTKLSGLFHMRMTWSDFTFHGRLDTAICRLVFGEPTINALGETCCAITGSGHDTIAGEFEIRNCGNGYTHDVKSCKIEFLLAYKSNNSILRFFGTIESGWCLAGAFDVYNPHHIPENYEQAMAQNEADVPQNSASLGLKSPASRPILGTFLMIPEHETNVTLLAKDASAAGINVNTMTMDKYELWRTTFLRPVRTENDDNPSALPWFVEDPHPAAELSWSAREYSYQTHLLYTGASTLYSMTLCKNQFLAEAPPPEMLQHLIQGPPITFPALGHDEIEAPYKFSARVDLFWPMSGSLILLRGHILRGVGHSLLADITILRDEAHPKHIETLIKYLEMLHMYPYEMGIGAQGLANDMETVWNTYETAQNNESQDIQPNIRSLMTKKKRGVSVALVVSAFAIGTLVLGAGAFLLGRALGRSKKQ